MTSELKIMSPGLLTSIQDKGRIGFAGYGVPRSGAVDPVSLRLGNALVGNSPYEAAIEFRFVGPKIRVEQGSMRVGLAGNFSARVTRAETKETEAIDPWRSVTLDQGDIVTIPVQGDSVSGYITVEGGLQMKPMLDSKSTYARANLGGVNGQMLQANDVLLTKWDSPGEGSDRIISKVPQPTKSPIRVILGPQDDYFSEAEITRFSEYTYRVSADIDRMGIRLEDGKIQAMPEKGHDLISDGLIPGAIQVPGSGDPIILFMDCQSVGGYPKIATVITADLYRLGQLGPGQELSFQPIDLAEAQDALMALEKKVKDAVASIKDYEDASRIDMRALYQSNLVSGVVDAQNPANFQGHLEEEA